MNKTHPTLYRSYLTYALLSIALGLNFLFLHPAFDPLGIPKAAAGVAFLGCGALKMVLMLAAARVSWLRASMALSVAIMTFWAAALTAEFFLRSQTSLQLPLTFIALAALGFLLTTEPGVNPATAKDDG